MKLGYFQYAPQLQLCWTNVEIGSEILKTCRDNWLGESISYLIFSVGQEL
jgi:hypothetical protein